MIHSRLCLDVEQVFNRQMWQCFQSSSRFFFPSHTCLNEIQILSKREKILNDKKPNYALNTLISSFLTAPLTIWLWMTTLNWLPPFFPQSLLCHVFPQDKMTANAQWADQSKFFFHFCLIKQQHKDTQAEVQSFASSVRSSLIKTRSSFRGVRLCLYSFSG